MTSPDIDREQRIDESTALMLSRLEQLARLSGYGDWPDRLLSLIASACRRSDAHTAGLAHVVCLLEHHSDALRRTSPDLSRLFKVSANVLLTHWAALVGASDALADLEVKRWDWGDESDTEA